MGGMGSWRNNFDQKHYHKSFNSQNTSKHKLLVFIAVNGTIGFILNVIWMQNTFIVQTKILTFIPQQHKHKCCKMLILF